MMELKVNLLDGSTEFLPEGDEDMLRLLVEKHTERSLTGAVSFLDDLAFKAASGRVVTLKEVRSVG